MQRRGGTVRRGEEKQNRTAEQNSAHGERGRTGEQRYGEQHRKYTRRGGIVHGGEEQKCAEERRNNMWWRGGTACGGEEEKHKEKKGKA